MSNDVYIKRLTPEATVFYTELVCYLCISVSTHGDTSMAAKTPLLASLRALVPDLTSLSHQKPGYLRRHASEHMNVSRSWCNQRMVTGVISRCRSVGIEPFERERSLT
jgi:hypothetical protein